MRKKLATLATLPPRETKRDIGGTPGTPKNVPKHPPGPKTDRGCMREELAVLVALAALPPFSCNELSSYPLECGYGLADDSSPNVSRRPPRSVPGCPPGLVRGPRAAGPARQTGPTVGARRAGRIVRTDV